MERLSRQGLDRSRILLWLGILAWVPYFGLLAAGQHISVFPFLGVHLTGVLGGLWRKRRRSGSDGKTLKTSGSRKHLVGNLLILMGILAWVFYFISNRYLAQDVSLRPFLIVHLTGILAGLSVRLGILDRYLNWS